MSTSPDSPPYVPTPTFSERMMRRKKADPETHQSNQSSTSASSTEPFPDVVRTHHLPLTLKSRRGDSLQVYLHSYARTEDGVLVYDVSFDDGTLKLSIPRSSLFVPPSTSYEMMRLQESQSSAARTPPRKSNKLIRRE